jgi:hypothetical protein
MLNIIIEVMGWISSILIVGAYFFNIQGKLASDDKRYILANLIGGIGFIVNTIYHHAYPSAMVNVVWVIIAIGALLKRKK